MNRTNQSELSFSCEAGSAKVNVFTGRLLFERTDIAMGANSFSMGVSHIYDSQQNLPTGQQTHLGNGWNLNIQQYLMPNTTNEHQATSFVYYDGEWSQARFCCI